MEQQLDFEHRLTAVEGRSASNTHRLDKLEDSTEAINRLATSMEVMAEKQDRVATKVDKLDGKVTALESKPGRRYDDLVEKVSWAILAAIASFILARVGL